jgi:hypothetical protein
VASRSEFDRCFTREVTQKGIFEAGTDRLKLYLTRDAKDTTRPGEFASSEGKGWCWKRSSGSSSRVFHMNAIEGPLSQSKLSIIVKFGILTIFINSPAVGFPQEL